MKRGSTATFLALLVTLFLLGSPPVQAASWQVVSSPDPGTTDNSLNGVAAVNASDIWTVGSYQNGSSPSQTLIEQWNGTSWQVVSSPDVGMDYNQLVGVVAIRATNIWAVGYTRNSSGTDQTLIEHWNGKSWKIIPSPDAGTGSNFLNGVAAVSSTNIWAVGSYQNSNGTNQALIEHWNGKSWQVVSSPDTGTVPNQLSGVAAVSASSIWAVGYSGAPSSPPTQTLTEHWNGKSWKIVPSPDPGTIQNSLIGVTAISGSNLWAVGAYANNNTAGQTLIEHWNGKSWKTVPSPNAGTAQNFLNSVAAVSSSNLWAVGSYANINNSPVQTLTEEYS